MVKLRLKKVPQSARLSAGGGGNCYLGGDKLKGASLIPQRKGSIRRYSELTSASA